MIVCDVSSSQKCRGLAVCMTMVLVVYRCLAVSRYSVGCLDAGGSALLVGLMHPSGHLVTPLLRGSCSCLRGRHTCSVPPLHTSLQPSSVLHSRLPREPRSAHNALTPRPRHAHFAPGLVLLTHHPPTRSRPLPRSQPRAICGPVPMCRGRAQCRSVPFRQ